MRSHIGWRGERKIPYKGVESSLVDTFYNLEGKPRRESPKRIISADSGLRLLQMVSESNTARYANKDAGSPKGWIVRSHIG